MKYAHLFWHLFGLSISEWDALLYDDFLWMKSTADDFEKKQREAGHG